MLTPEKMERALGKFLELPYKVPRVIRNLIGKTVGRLELKILEEKGRYWYVLRTKGDENRRNWKMLPGPDVRTSVDDLGENFIVIIGDDEEV